MKLTIKIELTRSRVPEADGCAVHEVTCADASIAPVNGLEDEHEDEPMGFRSDA